MSEHSAALFARAPSLELLVESEVMPLEILHPGGLATTRSLAELCGITDGMLVLDVASGTGEAACFLGDDLRAEVVGVDRSPRMVARARDKVDGGRAQPVRFVRGDAHGLPFRSGVFDVVVSECTLSLLDKAVVLDEMVRVTRAGGSVGMHEICWTEDAPDAVKRRLFELEGERPESLDGWKRLLEEAGLEDVRAVDRSELIPLWMRESKRSLGLGGQLSLAGRVLRRWGVRGLARILASERLFRSKYLGYGMFVGAKP